MDFETLWDTIFFCQECPEVLQKLICKLLQGLNHVDISRLSCLLCFNVDIKNVYVHASLHVLF